MPNPDSGLTRRGFLTLAGGAMAVGPARLVAAAATNETVRVASVPTAVEGGLLTALLKSFQAETGLGATLTASTDPYGVAAGGEADLVISHFGHRDTETFVTHGLGRWPRTVFANQGALLGPPGDPARVRGLFSLVEAFRRIADTQSPYVVNGSRYLTEVLWNAAGRPLRGAWFINQGSRRSDGVALAAERGGYVLWGLTPFLREQQASHRALEPLVTADSLLQRIMVSVVVAPAGVSGANAGGATRLQDYLLSPPVQARMLDIPYAGLEQVSWAPAGRHNAGAALPE